MLEKKPFSPMQNCLNNFYSIMCFLFIHFTKKYVLVNNATNYFTDLLFASL